MHLISYLLFPILPVIPAKAGIQFLCVVPRFRGDGAPASAGAVPGFLLELTPYLRGGRNDEFAITDKMSTIEGSLPLFIFGTIFVVACFVLAYNIDKDGGGNE